MPAKNSTPLAQALVIRELRGGRDRDDQALNGAALAVLRGDVLVGEHRDHPAAADERKIRERIMALGLNDMPPNTDLVAILIETLSQRLGGVGHANAWRSIGINPSRGREFMSRNARAVDWPIWKTLRDAALMTMIDGAE